MLSRFLATIALFTSALQTGTLLAHPGHGTTDPNTVTHYAIEPLHALPWMAVLISGVILAVSYRVLIGRRNRRCVDATIADRPTATSPE